MWFKNIWQTIISIIKTLYPSKSLIEIIYPISNIHSSFRITFKTNLTSILSNIHYFKYTCFMSLFVNNAVLKAYYYILRSCHTNLHTKIKPEVSSFSYNFKKRFPSKQRKSFLFFFFNFFCTVILSTRINSRNREKSVSLIVITPAAASDANNSLS